MSGACACNDSLFQESEGKGSAKRVVGRAWAVLGSLPISAIANHHVWIKTTQIDLLFFQFSINFIVLVCIIVGTYFVHFDEFDNLCA